MVVRGLVMPGDVVPLVVVAVRLGVSFLRRLFHFRRSGLGRMPPGKSLGVRLPCCRVQGGAGGGRGAAGAGVLACAAVVVCSSVMVIVMVVMVVVVVRVRGSLWFGPQKPLPLLTPVLPLVGPVGVLMFRD